eukprot:362353-Prymnesium_polylepis.1
MNSRRGVADCSPGYNRAQVQKFGWCDTCEPGMRNPDATAVSVRWDRRCLLDVSRVLEPIMSGGTRV